MKTLKFDTISAITSSFYLLSSFLLFATNIHAAGPPENNDCSTAFVFTGNTSCSYGNYTLEESTLTSDVPYAASCSHNPKREVWFKTTVPDSGVLVIKGTTDINPIISILVFTGSCGSLEYYDCTDEIENGTDYLLLGINDSALSGDDIYIAVTRGNSNVKGNFNLCVYEQSSPINEEVEDAILLTNESGVFSYTSFSNEFASNSLGSTSDNCGAYEGGDVWFKTMVPPSGKLVVSAQSTGIDPVLALYTGAPNNLVYKTCASLSGGTTEIVLDDVLLADEIVYIRTYANNKKNGGVFELLVLEPTQDICGDAIPLDGNKAIESYQPYTNKYASLTNDGPAGMNPSCGNYKNSDIWFVIDVPASGELIFDSKPSEDMKVMPVLSVYSGSCSNLTEVDCNLFGSSNPFGGKVSITASDNLANQTIYLRMHNYNSSEGGTFDLSVHNPSAELPVELVRFTANAIDSEVVLDWTTATEENNDYFLIEHSVDGEHFIPIDKVDGNGTTSELQHYTYNHRNPYFGENYYRLKQVDLDGQYEYFEVVVATIRLSEEQFKLFPNPGFTKDVLTLRWSEDLGIGELEIAVTDALGRRIYRQIIEDSHSREATINCSEINMDAGLYFLQLSNERRVVAHRRFNLIVD